MLWRVRCVLAVLAAAGLALAAGAPAAGAEPVVDGDVRIEVITPRLVRLEHAPGGAFEDRPTMLGFDRDTPAVPFRARVEGDRLVVETARVTVSYRRGSGAFGDDNLDVRVDGERVRPRWEAQPYVPPPGGAPPGGYFAADPGEEEPRTAGNLGGWARALDNQSGPRRLNDGLLSRDGWAFVDDSTSVLLTDGGASFAHRATPAGYQDGYLFGYGQDYRAALRDYRTLSGAAPLLPRKAFGVWFSRYAPYSETDYRETLIPRFRAERVPLDVLVVDTDYKAPHPWAGWQWRSSLFPDPRRFLDWAHGEELEVPLNVHPSISADDPALPATLATAGGPLPQSLGGQVSNATLERGSSVPHFTFEWADQRQLQAYFDLHAPFEADGADFWWLDWCCEEARVDGVKPTGEISGDAWINMQYARRNAARGTRWPAFARIGGSYEDWQGDQPGPWGEQRSSIHFTGDAISTWEMLSFQARFAAAEAGIGVPYVTHDIGGFGNGLAGGAFGGSGDLDPELYARWVQLGTFQPILRLHSSNAGDPRRLPWEFDGAARASATRFLRLRGALVPYLYGAARQAQRTGIAMTRPLYLRWPALDEAYAFDREYLLGDDLLVAPVAVAGDPARTEVWFPPGRWTDIFTGRRFRGPATRTITTPLDRMPVYARDGAILPLAPYRRASAVQPGRMILRVFGARARGSTRTRARASATARASRRSPPCAGADGRAG